MTRAVLILTLLLGVLGGYALIELENRYALEDRV